MIPTAATSTKGNDNEKRTLGRDDQEPCPDQSAIRAGHIRRSSAPP